jgi:hypothetical protein
MRQLAAAGACCAVLLATQSVAAPPETKTAMTKRQISNCMVKRMGADKTLSYNDAMRVCSEQSQPAKPALAAVAPSDLGAKAH